MTSWHDMLFHAVALMSGTDVDYKIQTYLRDVGYH